MFSMRAAVGKEITSLAETALQHELYVPGWTLCRLLTRMAGAPRDDDAIAIVYRNDEAVSVAVLTGGSETCAAYTKPEVRKNGFGRAALMGLRVICGKEFKGHMDGADGSVDFFTKCGLSIANYWIGS